MGRTQNKLFDIVLSRSVAMVDDVAVKVTASHLSRTLVHENAPCAFRTFSHMFGSHVCSATAEQSDIFSPGFDFGMLARGPPAVEWRDSFLNLGREGS